MTTGSRRSLAIVVATLLSLTGTCAWAGPAAQKQATFMTAWVPQAQFAGYYVALEKGLYRKYGIDLAIIHGGPGRSTVDYLKAGKTDFAGIWLSTALQQRSAGFRLVNIGQIVQKSALMLVAKKARGIRTAGDLQGKRVGLWGGDFSIQPSALFKKNNVRVQVVPQSVSLDLFLRDGVDAASAMWYNEYHTIINSGINPDELTTFFFQDYGLNFPEDGIYAREEAFRADPGLACNFVRASIEGWLYAFDHPEETVGIVIGHMAAARLPANTSHQKWMLARFQDLVVPADAGSIPGVLRRADFVTVATALKEAGFIAEIPDFDDFAARCEADGNN